MTTQQTKNAIDEILTTEAQKKAAANLKADWLQSFNKAASPSAALAGIAVPPCRPIVGKWFKQGDLGFICGPRGLGKTWWAMLLARKCAEGISMGQLPALHVHSPQRVLYVDGEMSLDGIRERDHALTAVPTPNIIYLQHEALFHLTGKVLNLAEPQAQAALLEKCIQDKITILVLDNLSCLFSGMRENDADAWERVLPWLLDLRRHRISVIFVAHCGRNGLMRGTSRREDAAFWIINLSQLKDPSDERHGAKFVAKFVKNRNTSDADCPPLEWTFLRSPNDSKTQVTWKKVSVPELFRKAIEDGLSTASAIAEEISLSRSQVSKYATKAMKEGWLAKKDREYVLVSEDEAKVDQELNKQLDA
ncbi:MAG TPA: AAA family ATPase [Candidatus Sulfotelmatobacter sp.]|nr:AAA family ATPase [Candidatus Sulfotelmatobacter sp.]